MGWLSRVGFACALSIAGCATSGGDARKAPGELDKPTWLVDLPADGDLDDDATAAAKRGRTALASGDGAAALAAFDAALEAEPDAVILHIERAMALLLSGRPQEAIKALAGARSARGLNAVRRDLVRLHAMVDLGRTSEAMLPSKRLAELYPLVLDAHYAMGRIYLALGKRLEALRAFDEVRAAAPDHKPSQLGALAAMSAKPDGDYAALERQLRRRWPNDPDLLVIVGAAREVTGRDTEAADLYERVLALSPNHPTANFNLARLTEERQGLEAARPYYERFLKSAPGARSRHVQQLRKRLSRTPKAPGGGTGANP